ncbi:endo-beta-N-acetylglucosaminidase [Mycoplasma marinum]|uniref:Cytosolic endo-beta-N-acetylglucosaminidase TIM barrel domain-containing protein n=1 Tax=Mycoplasma marinum TaxID=1937190 RepID=A0A4V2NHX9_9MOLU|nr:hypothetical protein [Mycoplasma marinum]TCG10548.1 hypothetical protein C4B24_04495 [Mycoplasma marinum]
MEKKKISRTLTPAIILSLVAIPSAVLVSCGTTNQVAKDKKDSEKTINKMNGNPFIIVNKKKDDSKTQTGQTASSGDVLIGQISKDALKEIPKYWGYGRKKDINASDSFAPAEYNSRKITGAPKSPTLDIEDAWNWSPEGTANGIPKAGDLRVSKNKTGVNADIDFTWGAVDGDFNRARVREVKPRIFGAKIKPTQSTFARYSQMNWNSSKNGNNDIGILGGRNSTSDAYIQNHWQYTNDMVTWGGGKSLTLKMPTGAQIDTAHRNGVPIMGVVFMYAWGTGESSHDTDVMLNPGPKGDFPLAKGMVELADYYGFDGWMVDWESKAPSDAFLNKWREYAHASSNISNPTSIQRKFHYYHKPQSVTNYWFDNVTASKSDIFYYPQKHGGDVSASRMQNAILNKPTNKDKYFVNGACNYPEDGYEKCREITKGYIDGSIKWSNEHNNTIGRLGENRRSQWMYSYTDSDNIQTDEEFFSSTVGDPRYSGRKHNDSNYAVSDGFQERTSIIGRKNWTTTFDFGSGNHFNLFGFNDINPYMVHANENGWKDTNMQSYLPTYRWIVDEYDASGHKTSDYNRLNSKGKVDRKITPILNNQSNAAWFGGTNISYKGSLKPGESFENKLFASAIPIQDNDKFTIKIKNGGQIPELLTETKDGKINTNSVTTVDDMGEILSPQTPTTTYAADSTWNFKRTKNIISGTPKIIGNSGWTEVTYDLSKLSGKTITSFGIKATAVQGNTNFNKLKLGEMHFQAHEHIQETATISNLRTTKVWNGATIPEGKARIKWDETLSSPTAVRNYFVFYADENFNATSLAWEGANPVAYLDRLDKSKDKQNIVIMAIDNDYKVIMNQKATITLKN